MMFIDDVKALTANAKKAKAEKERERKLKEQTISRKVKEDIEVFSEGYIKLNIMMAARAGKDDVEIVLYTDDKTPEWSNQEFYNHIRDVMNRINADSDNKFQWNIFDRSVISQSEFGNKDVQCYILVSWK